MGSGFLGPPTASAVGAAPFHKMSASMWGKPKEQKTIMAPEFENIRAVTWLVWAVLGRKMSLRESRGSEMVLK